jgi:hypothetical protein
MSKVIPLSAGCLRDFGDLTSAAEYAIHAALEDGDAGGKHAPGSWRNETVEEQLRHIIDHAEAYLRGDRSENHLTHIPCRAAIAFALDQNSNG